MSTSLKFKATVVFRQEDQSLPLILRTPMLDVGVKINIRTPSGVTLEATVKSLSGFDIFTGDVEVPEWMDFDELQTFLLRRKWVHAPRPEEKFFKQRAGS